MFQKRKWIAAFLTLALAFSLCNTGMGVSEVKAQEAETNEYEYSVNVVSDSTEDTDSTAPHVSSVSIQPNITDGVFEQKLTCSMDVTDVGVAKPTSVE